jgi:tight adherence protein B
MPIVIVTVFLGVFVVTGLLLTGLGAGASAQLRRTLSRLDAVTPHAERGRGDEAAIVLRQELLSSIPWLDRWLRDADLFGGLRKLLRQADLEWTVASLVMWSLVCGLAAGAVAYLRTRAPGMGVLLGAAAACAPLLYVLKRRSLRFEAFERMLPEALELMVSALRAGHGLNSAIGMVAKEFANPIGREFRQCFEEQNFGLELRAAMLNLVERVPVQDVRIMTTAVLVQNESGGNLAEILEKVAVINRERFRLKRQIRVHTAQGRLTGWILALLPLVLGIALYLVKPEGISILWRHPTGLKMLYGAIVMTLIGALIIRKIVSVRV